MLKSLIETTTTTTTTTTITANQEKYGIATELYSNYLQANEQHM